MVIGGKPVFDSPKANEMIGIIRCPIETCLQLEAL